MVNSSSNYVIKIKVHKKFANGKVLFHLNLNGKVKRRASEKIIWIRFLFAVFIRRRDEWRIFDNGRRWQNQQWSAIEQTHFRVSCRSESLLYSFYYNFMTLHIRDGKEKVRRTIFIANGDNKLEVGLMRIVFVRRKTLPYRRAKIKFRLITQSVGINWIYALKKKKLKHVGGE